MNVYDSLEAAAVCRHAVIALGTFDGVHVGHRRVMETAMSEGKRLHVPTLVLTFSAHPLSVLNPLKEPARLATVEQKEEYIRSVGIDGLIMLPMTQELLNQSPEDFCACLIKYLSPSEIVVGTNFTYGKKAAGNTETLVQSMGDAHIPVRVLDLVEAPQSDYPVSSTVIRGLIAEGKMQAAMALLGRPFELRAEVVSGDRRGRTIGFPTANMLIPPKAALPPDGVYVTGVVLDGKEWPAMTNIGNNPTFTRQYRRVETHILDWSGDIYGKTVTLRFYKRLRDEKKFSSITELVDAMKVDKKKVLLHFSAHT